MAPPAADGLRTAGTVSTIVRELAQEQWQLYPQDERQLLPTRGNALKSLETYAMTRYALDSQAFWYELHGVSSLALRQDVDDTRASVDFFVGLTLNLAVFGAIAIPIGMASEWNPAALIVGMLALAALPLLPSRSSSKHDRLACRGSGDGEHEPKRTRN